MNGPRTKNEAELSWNAIKKAIQAQVNFEAQVWRERRLNVLIDDAWRDFSSALADDVILGPGKDILGALGPGGTK